MINLNSRSSHMLGYMMECLGWRVKYDIVASSREADRRGNREPFPELIRITRDAQGYWEEQPRNPRLPEDYPYKKKWIARPWFVEMLVEIPKVPERRRVSWYVQLHMGMRSPYQTIYVTDEDEFCRVLENAMQELQAITKPQEVTV